VEDGRIIYFVQALKVADTNERVTSTSNRFPLFKEATLYFPNAFRPDGTNNSFKPVFSFFGGTNYLLQIYSRWGKLIFETNDPGRGWDGTSQNEPVEKGAYIYISTYRSVTGTTITQKGTVMLIR
jgi:gliding motility-associated-like protein